MCSGLCYLQATTLIDTVKKYLG